MICFVIALEDEAAPVLANMTDVRAGLALNKKVYSGKLCGEETRVIVCGVGKVNAAMGATMAAACAGASAVINIGTAGALGPSMRVGDIYAVSHAAEYDYDLRQINGTQAGVLDDLGVRWIPLETADGYTAKKLATGDRFNDDRADYLMLTEDFKADLRDMEGAAVAHACAYAGVPPFGFKVVSDVAGSGSTTDQYQKNVALCYENIRRETCAIFRAVRNKIQA